MARPIRLPQLGRKFGIIHSYPHYSWEACVKDCTFIITDHLWSAGRFALYRVMSTDNCVKPCFSFAYLDAAAID